MTPLSTIICICWLNDLYDSTLAQFIEKSMVDIEMLQVTEE